ncbi:MAG: PAS domain S-box protein [Anaerolineae bacterium]|jgi:PAS domain S-box-containing protein|nr:PAS domain S-box protein [Chloroflexota bacterium]
MERRAAGVGDGSFNAEGRLRTLLGNLQELILVIHADGQILEVAGNSMGLVGYAPGELRGNGVHVNLMDLFALRDRDRLRDQLDEVTLHPQGSSREVRIVDRAGEERWVECVMVPLYDDALREVSSVQVILRDVSDRVRAQQIMHGLNAAATAVQDASLSLSDVVEAVTDELFALGLNSVIALYSSDHSQLNWVGFRGDTRFRHAVELVVQQPHPATLNRARAILERAARTAQSVIPMDLGSVLLAVDDPFSARQIAQALGPMTGVLAPLRTDGQLIGFLFVASSWISVENVSAIQAYANQTAIAIRNSRLMGLLTESESQYRAIFEAARDGLILADAEGHVTAASRTTCRLFDMELYDMLGSSIESLFTVSLESVALCSAGESADESSTLSTQAVASGGRTFPVELRGSCVQFDGQPHMMLLITDISERIRAQEALVQAERMSALGQIAGGIAHDFNNILVSILGYTQMAIDDLARNATDAMGDYLAQIEAGAHDAAEAVLRVQAFYRETNDLSDLVPVQLDQVVTDALALHRPRWKDIPQFQGVTYSVDTQLAEPPAVLGNAGELRRVVSNLLINALDAMPQGGTLLFRTWQDGTETCLMIQDTGCGIAPQFLARVVEPFYTTKKSSGLGLTVSDSIVRRHGGTMSIASTQGAGTTVTLRFPSGGLAGSHQSEGQASSAAFTGSLNSLVVDDEERVRTVLGRLLERQGHVVDLAGSGPEGLAALQQAHYDLLICDLGMPGMPGTMVMQEARARYPQLAIVVTTGWGETITPEQLREMCADALLSKPFGQEDVRQVVAQAMNRRTTG